MDSEIFAGCVCNTHPEIFEEGILIDCRPCIMRVLIFEGIYVYSRGDVGGGPGGVVLKLSHR